ncbi:hypothetical protein, partial [Flavobacterium sp.]|uniref:hypothetical protein n=1 Tax=Flavobacterium sp. TaxID=239 RepID=UPI002FD91D20
SGTFNYSIPLTGGCGSITATGTIIVDPASVGGTVTSNQTLCSGTVPADLTLLNYAGSIVKWQSALNAAFTSPTDISATSATLSGATIGTLTQSTYFRALVQNGSCGMVASASALITVSSATIGGSVTGGMASCTGLTSGLLTLAGHTGAVVRWESSISPFTSWTSIANTATTYTSGALTQTTKFRAVVQSGVCSAVYSTDTTVEIKTTTWDGTIWDHGYPDGSNLAAAVIPTGTTFISDGTDLEACSLTVANGATVTISSGDTVFLNGTLSAATGSSVTFDNNANLIQGGSTNTNLGTIVINRDSSLLKRQDYTLWSTPVTGPQTLFDF